MEQGFIAVDLVKVYRTKEKKPSNLLTVLAWGDIVDILETTSTHIRISLLSVSTRDDDSPTSLIGFILRKAGNNATIIKPMVEKDVLQVSYVDVQQGDGCIIESADGKIMLIDGGENQMFARYLASRYHGSALENPRIIDCILVTHGDADHFKGLPEILKSEKNDETKKRLFIQPLRVYHNGIVKRPASVNGKKRADKELLGETLEKEGQLYLTDLHNDLLQSSSREMNTPFREWKDALKEYAEFYGPINIKRLDHTSTSDFSFLKNITVEILGPLVEDVNGKPALKFLRTPPKSVAKSIRDEENKSSSYSASHTINGHSVIVRMTYGNVRFLFAGDLNEESEKRLVMNSKSSGQSIQSEVLKVPHHGSADFSDEFLKAVNPTLSIVSSGDESELKDYIHPRATLIGALGKYSRTSQPLIFVTEMVAFLKKEGKAALVDGRNNQPFFAFSRSAFGIVHVRTDGKRILVFTHSSKADLKEAYAFTIGGIGAEPQRDDVLLI